jgi:predicted  nucleic acid-binding Zn-ribbon protein
MANEVAQADIVSQIQSMNVEGYVQAIYGGFYARLEGEAKAVEGVGYDIATPAGYKAAVALRKRFRDIRLEAERERKARKEPINKIGKLLDSTYRDLEARILPYEDRYDADIRAEDERKAKIQREQEEAEQAKRNALLAKIEAIKAIPGDSLELSSVELVEQYTLLNAMPISREEYGDLWAEATEAQSRALTLLHRMEQLATEREIAQAMAARSTEEPVAHDVEDHAVDPRVYPVQPEQMLARRVDVCTLLPLLIDVNAYLKAPDPVATAGLLARVSEAIAALEGECE